MSSGTRRLAILGGSPALSRPLVVGRPDSGDRGAFLARVNEILDSGWLTNDGRYLRRFEHTIASVSEAAHCVAFSSGAMALELLVQALGVSGEVILPSFTFPATVHALARRGVEPVFADIDRDTFCISAQSVAPLLTPRVSAILGVHCWGTICDIPGLARLARQASVGLFFDGAHALGCTHLGQALGNYDFAQMFSFHATKFVQAGEGGAVITNDSSLARELRQLRNFGFADDYRTVSVGTNGKMSEIAAALGLTSIESMDRIVDANGANHRAYKAALSGVPGITLVPRDPAERHNYQYVVVLVDEGGAGISRDTLLDVLAAENVFARKYFWPGCHRQPIYRARSGHVRLPVTEMLAERVLILPTGTAVTVAEIRIIGEIIACAVAGAADLQRLPATSRP